MSISVDNLLDETLNHGPLTLLLRRQYVFPSEIYILQFSFFFFHCKEKQKALTKATADVRSLCRLSLLLSKTIQISRTCWIILSLYGDKEGARGPQRSQ